MASREHSTKGLHGDIDVLDKSTIKLYSCLNQMALYKETTGFSKVPCWVLLL